MFKVILVQLFAVDTDIIFSISLIQFHSYYFKLEEVKLIMNHTVKATFSQSF